MRLVPSLVAATSIAVLLAGPSAAHHSVSTLDLARPVWISGTVLRYEPRNPHVLIHLEERGADGGVRERVVDGPIVMRLQKMGLARDFLRPGDVIGVCAFAYREHRAAQSTPEDGRSLPPMHGHVLRMPDGRLQAWGPYGKLDNCVREGDPPARWVAFIEGAPIAREYWCRGIATRHVPSTAPPALVVAISRALAAPCQ